MFKDLPKVLQLEGRTSRGPEAGSVDPGSEHQKGRRRKKRSELATRKLVWRGRGKGMRISRIGWARPRLPPLPKSQVFSLVEFSPSPFKYVLITPQAKSGGGH